MKSKQVALSEVTAVMCNYARPGSARAVVKRLRNLGLTEIIVWNNGGAKPVAEATQNINHAENIGTIGRYHAALHSKRPYILIVDDDVLLTKKGLEALLKYAGKYPLVVQAGLIYSSPFQKKPKRIKILSDQIKKPTAVDVAIANRGMIMNTDLYRSILKHWAWGCLQQVRQGFFTTDIPVSCATYDRTGRHPMVVPVSGRGYVMLPDEAPEKALRNQKNFNAEKTKILKWLVKRGWKLLGDR
ncbi:MAG TPA: glycosyltransferase [Bacillota bacterium]